MKTYHAEHRDEHVAYMRERHQQIRETDNDRRRQHHHANKDHANGRRLANYYEHREENRPVRKEKAVQSRIKVPWSKMYWAAKGRAKKKGVPFTITLDWAKARYAGVCELTGIPFVLGQRGSGPKPYSPSIDRIDPAVGYTPENCRFILWAVSALKHVGTDADMLFIARALVEKHQ